MWSEDALLAESAAPERDPLATVYVYEPASFRPLALAVRNTPTAPAAVYRYHLDHLGTPRQLTDAAGAVVWAAEYTAWGAAGERGAVAQPLRFQGQYADGETGLHYNRVRNYSPAEGRFVSEDPVRLAGGANLGAYAPNPVLWADPLGLTCDPGSNKRFYRTMSEEHFVELRTTGRVPATRETMTSPTRAFSESDDGALVEFQARPGTTAALERVGVRDNSRIARTAHPDMPEVSRGWNEQRAYFKGENDGINPAQINIGLGGGTALDTFNDSIVSFTRLR